MTDLNNATEENMKKKFVRTSAQTAMIVAVLTLVSKIFGFVREMVMANYYGTSYVVDAYVMANAIPGILFGGVFGALATAFMPIFSKTIEQQGEEEANRFTSATINIMLLAAIVSCFVGLMYSDEIVSIFASQFPGRTAALCSIFVKVTFSLALITSISGILNAYLQYKGVFIAQVLAGYLQNVFLITFIIISVYTKEYFIILGYVFAYTALLIIYAILSKHKGYKYKFTLRSGGTTRKIATLAVPVFIGSMAGQINTFVDKTLASGLPEGSVSALNYGMLLISMITGLTVSILSMLIYPKLTQAFSQLDYERFNNIIGTGTILMTMIAMPACWGAMAFSEQVVQVVFERGAFDPSSTDLTSAAFFYYAVGLWPLAVTPMLSQTFYAMHNAKIPAILGFISVGINITLNLILIRYMAHAGLALATSITAFVSLILYYVSLKRKYPQIEIIKSTSKIMKILMASVIAVGITLLFYKLAIPLISHILYPRMLQLLLCVGIGAIIYYILLKIIKVEEIKMFTNILKK